MDGPNVNKKFYDMHNSQRIECGLHHQLITIETCSSLIVNGAFKNGEEPTWKIKKILKGMCQLLHDSPARRDDYISINGSNAGLPLFFCATR